MQGLLEIYWCLVPLAIFAAALLAFQTWEHRRFVRCRVRSPFRSVYAGRAAVLIACKGADVDLEANLRPLFEQDHEDFELIFAVEGIADGAHATIQRLKSQYPAIKAKLVIAGASVRHGQKVHNLLAATRDLHPDIATLVFVDADVRPRRDWLRLLTDRLDHCHAATGYRWFVPKRATLANCLLASINGGLIPVMFPGRHRKVWGGSWAIRRQAFDRGDFRQAWHGTLSDDLVAGHVLARQKYRVAEEPACIIASPIDVSLREMFAFVRRQLTITRVYEPRVWLLFLIYSGLTQMVFWGSVAGALWGLVTAASWAWQPAAVTAVLYLLHVARGWLRQRAAHDYMAAGWRELAAARHFDIWLAPVTGLAGLCGLLSSAFGRSIEWKGIEYEMQAGGQLLGIKRPVGDVRTSPLGEVEPLGRQVAA